MLSLGEGTKTAGDTFLLYLRSTGVFTLSYLLLSIREMGEKFARYLLLNSLESLKVTGTSLEVSIRAVGYRVGHLSSTLS